MSVEVVDRSQVGRLGRAMELIWPIVIIMAGVAVSVGLALIPGTVFSSQPNGGCGTPVVDAFTVTHGSFEASCRHEGYAYVAVGLIVGGLIVWGGLSLLLWAAPRDRSVHRLSRRRLVASALAACVLVVVAVAVAGTVTYQTGSQAPIYSGDE
jgi:hypothetical protein